MAYGLENYPNNTPINADYPYGQIVDDNGSGNGTPVNKLVYDDIHQNFRRLLTISGATPNGDPDNVSNGYQYVDAMKFLYKNFRGVVPTSTNLTLTSSYVRKIIYVEGNSGAVTIDLPASASLQDCDSIVFYNNEAYIVTIQGDGSDTINSFSNIGLIQKDDFVELALDKANANWVVTNYKITNPPTNPNYVVMYANGTPHNSVTSFVAIFNNTTSNPGSTYNTANGKLTPNVAGIYELSMNVLLDNNGTGSNGILGVQVNKNGVMYANFLDRKQFLASDDWFSSNSSIIVNANGTTDYFEVVVSTSVTSSTNLYGTFTCKQIVK